MSSIIRVRKEEAQAPRVPVLRLMLLTLLLGGCGAILGISELDDYQGTAGAGAVGAGGSTGGAGGVVGGGGTGGTGGGCVDNDGDGYGTGCVLGDDCNDEDPLQHPGAPELPGDGLAQTCTGYGDLVPSDAKGVFVDGSAGHDDSPGTGTMDWPYKTVNKGVSQAELDSKAVFVAEGTYDEDLITASVSIFGGYASVSWERDIAAHETTIRSTNTIDGRTIWVPSDASVALEGLTLTPLDGQDSFATVMVEGQATIAHCKILGDSGGSSSVALFVAGYVIAYANEVRLGNGTNNANGIVLQNAVAEARLVAINNIVVPGAAAPCGNCASPSGIQTVAGAGGRVAHLFALNNTIIAGAGGSSLGIDLSNADGLVANNIIVANGTANSAYAVSVAESATSLRLLNNNLWGTGLDGLLRIDTASTVASISAVNDCGWTHCTRASGNISADPKFANANSDDYQLLAGSPCIDSGAGDQSGLEVPDYDKDHNPRVDDQSVVDTGSGSPTYVDIGAYERQD